MKIWILSRYDSTGLGSIVDGVFGAFDALEKAKLEACKHMDAYGEELLDWDSDEFNGLFNYFSTKGTYHIESIILNDSCFE